ncbi:glycosyltransferase family 4 protein [filamentous cyanobacterium LEGE 11480]|uniref:Glycosyltransferase family 4 protein n=1 Tax=Romeriopsis navalis LEGE 11480 TaxID=2777977 RepID=A0A928VQD6_9CYAN|nr:glycosyltransferase family 4 protein [Romeriopsis navalis]MBE9031001.1 glycosyltransferase family 4 protein [Romeriopsis navalis LEGE 11480]
MKIALISYEYPPDTAIGGIATYVRQAAHMLAQRGHTVEVFAASPDRAGSETDAGVTVHRIQPTDRQSFATEITPIFTARHQAIQFDVAEGPDCGADAAGIGAKFPELPMVLKLHTPSYMLRRVGRPPLSLSGKARFILGGLRRGQWPQLTGETYDRQRDPEYHNALRAQEIAAPCNAIKDLVRTEWELNPVLCASVPYPYIPTPSLLDIPLDTSTQRVTFIGRLEIRKGILDLMRAIPLVLQQYPAAKFRFVGPAWPSPQANLNMQEYLSQKLRRYAASLEFVGAVPLDRIPEYLAQTDICVFPSIWENFPLVCLESMAAGRGVVGSHAGGMAEMLDGGNAGLLIPPKQPKPLAEALLQLLQDPDRRQQLGGIARERVLTEYSLENIGQRQEASYQAAITRHHKVYPPQPLASSPLQIS